MFADADSPEYQQETEDLEIFGETQIKSSGETLPCRYLDNFCFFDADNFNHYVPMTSIGEIGTNVLAAGLVWPINQDSDDIGDQDDDDYDSDNEELGLSTLYGADYPVQKVQLSAVFHFEDCLGDSGLGY